jgi:uncharacterized membrane protein
MTGVFNMPEFLKVYLIAVVSFFAIDMVWLGVVAKNLYREQIGFIMKTNFNWIAAFSFYFLYIFGLVFFVINPALEKGEFSYALIAGALFGLITYATYDLTNLATLENWSLKITIIDLVWGTVLGASVSSLTYYLVGLFK